MSLQYVTAWADWTGETTIKSAVYGVGAEPFKAAKVVATCDDRAVQDFAERHLAEYGLEAVSDWSVAPDPGGKPGDRRMVWIAGAGPVGGEIPCQRPDADPDAWYPISDKADATQADPSPEQAERLEALAAALCAGCPLRKECLAAGLDEPYGIWGGEAPHQRRERRRAYFSLERAV